MRFIYSFIHLCVQPAFMGHQPLLGPCQDRRYNDGLDRKFGFKEISSVPGFRAGFSNLSTLLTVWAGHSFCQGCCVQYKTFSSVPSLHPLDSSSGRCSSSHDYQKISADLNKYPLIREGKLPPVKLCFRVRNIAFVPALDLLLVVYLTNCYLTFSLCPAPNSFWHRVGTGKCL